jgi:hypothetical protein
MRAAAKPVEPVSGPVEPVLVSLPSRRRPLFSLISSLLSISLSLSHFFQPLTLSFLSLYLSPPPLKSLSKSSKTIKTS